MVWCIVASIPGYSLLLFSFCSCLGFVFLFNLFFVDADASPSPLPPLSAGDPTDRAVPEQHGGGVPRRERCFSRGWSIDGSIIGRQAGIFFFFSAGGFCEGSM